MQKLVDLANPQQKENLKFGQAHTLLVGVCDALLLVDQTKWVKRKNNVYTKLPIK
jgi:hypothetical protein